MIQDIYPHKLDNHYKPGLRAKDTDTVFCFSGEQILCCCKEDQIYFPCACDCAETESLIYLFSIDGQRFFLSLEEQTEFNGGALRRERTEFAGGAGRQGEIEFTGEAGRQGEIEFAGGAVTREQSALFIRSGQTEQKILTGERILQEQMASSGQLLHEAKIDFSYTPLRSLRKKNAEQKPLIFAAVTARHLNVWYRANRFCGGCGQPLRLSQTERAMVCPACGRVFYPRINPAVIVGVMNGENLLLTKYAGRDLPFYALVAGFTEIGETFEETVQREVMEETGLQVTDIRYYKSQPWGFSGDILAGYFCRVKGSAEIHMDTSELKEAVWMPRKEVPGQPDDFSLTNEMMLAFRDGLV